MKKRIPILILAACAIGFLAGTLELFRLRFETGDMYPEYSSLRAGPLGTMVLYESLEKLPRIEVKRDFSAEGKLPEGASTSYLHLGANIWEWCYFSGDDYEEINQFATKGGRLVVTFFPQSMVSPFMRGAMLPPAIRTNAAVLPKKSPGGKSAKRNFANLGDWQELRERLGLELDFSPLSPGVDKVYQPALAVNQSKLPLPDILNWHSGIVFTNLDKSWQVIYSRGYNPVVIERKIGKGSIVFASDSFFISNEGLQKDRHAELLAWLVGQNRKMLFDEAHFGIVEHPGMAGLMWKYRLHGVALGLLLLVGLFIWQQAVSFVPSPPAVAASREVVGREAGSGFVNLLRRNVKPGELLGVCFQEWSKSLLQRSGFSLSRVDQAQNVMEAEQAQPVLSRNPVRAYREISRILGKKRH